MFVGVVKLTVRGELGAVTGGLTARTTWTSGPVNLEPRLFRLLTEGNLQMKKPEIVWFLTKGGVPPPPLLWFGTFLFFSYNFFIALK